MKGCGIYCGTFKILIQLSRVEGGSWLSLLLFCGFSGDCLKMDAAKRAVKRKLVYDDHPMPRGKCLEQSQTLDDLGWEEYVESDSSDERYLSGKAAVKGEEEEDKPIALTQPRTWKHVAGSSGVRPTGKPTAAVAAKVVTSQAVTLMCTVLMLLLYFKGSNRGPNGVVYGPPQSSSLVLPKNDADNRHFIICDSIVGTVKRFDGKVFVDIRKAYMKEGQLIFTRMGICVSVSD